MARTYAVTGAASGIGRATRELLESQGHHVIGIDLRDTDVTVDLSTTEGRDALAAKVGALSDGRLDAVVAVAGVSTLNSLAPKVNYFGAKASLENLRPLLAGSPAPRAALVASFSTIQDVNVDLVAAMRADDEPRAIEIADSLTGGAENFIYASTKRAIAEWMREASITPEWAGAGIPLNGVGPGTIRTPMTAPNLDTPEGLAMMLSLVPMPLNGIADPLVIARALAFLVSEENTHMAGQLLFVDGGADVTLRGPHVFG